MASGDDVVAAYTARRSQYEPQEQLAFFVAAQANMRANAVRLKAAMSRVICFVAATAAVLGTVASVGAVVEGGRAWAWLAVGGTVLGAVTLVSQRHEVLVEVQPVPDARLEVLD